MCSIVRVLLLGTVQIRINPDRSSTREVGGTAAAKWATTGGGRGRARISQQFRVGFRKIGEECILIISVAPCVNVEDRVRLERDISR